MLVAVRAVEINKVSNAPRPYIENMINPTKNGTITPNAPTVKDAAPPLRNSLGVISNPATNKITMADSSPICLIVSSNTTIGPPSNIGNPLKHKVLPLSQLKVPPIQQASLASGKSLRRV